MKSLKVAHSITAAVLAMLGSSAFAQSYTFNLLNLPNQPAYGNGISNAAYVVGGAAVPGRFGELGTGFVCDITGKNYASFGYTASASTTAFGINSSGTIVGEATFFQSDGSEIIDGLVGRPGAWQTFSYPGSEVTEARGINSSNVIVGYSELPSYDYVGFSYSNGSFVTLRYPGALNTWASGINDSGLIVGYAQLPSSLWIGWVYDGTSYVAIQFPGAQYTTATGINSSGAIVGNYEIQTYGANHGFLYQSGSVSKLPDPHQSPNTTYNGINDAGELVGLAMIPSNDYPQTFVAVPVQ